MLVTLGDRHHLDSLVVIGSLVIIRQSLWMTQVKESAHREYLILAFIKGELHPCVVLQRGLVGSADSPIPRENIVVFLSLSLL